MKNNSVPNIWSAQERLLHFYRLTCLWLAVFGVLTTGCLIGLQFRNPIVAVERSHHVDFFPSERKRMPLVTADVEEFTKRFLVSLYVWDDFNVESISRSMLPYSQDGLAEKVMSAQGQKYLKELKGKRLSQSLAFVKVNVLEDRVVCRFDRILKIEGIPLVIPTEVTLSMVQGAPTEANTMGVYVGGIKESDSVK